MNGTLPFDDSANASVRALEFDRIRAMLKALTVSPGAGARADALCPLLNVSLCREALRETGDARKMMEAEGQPPLAMMEGLEDAVRAAEIETLMTPAQLSTAALFSATCRRMTAYLKKCELMRVELSLNGRGFLPLDDMEREIDAAIRGDAVADGASNHLRDVRRKIDTGEAQIKERLAGMLRAHPLWFADGYVAMRGGRQTLPVRAQYRAMVTGSVIDRSQTGGTLFIEPQSVRSAQEELEFLRIDEENEVRRILYALSALVADAAQAVRANMRLMERLDFAFAKGKLSMDMDAREAPFTEERALSIVGGRHPLLDREKAVPLDFSLSGGGIIITGPNTGGKTVALKTVGLFCLMAQSGLHIPVGEGSALCMMNQVLCDIGDGQSIAENLSTFSAHMTRVLDVLRRAGRDSLVLLDELGSGTDPAEGMGLAIAVLDELIARECLFVVTTHYPEVKEYARRMPGVVNARMTFNAETLAPLYRMIVGEAGESCALQIAKRLGFPEAILRRAEQAAYRGVIVSGIRKSAPAGGAGPRVTDYAAPRTAPARACAFRRGDSVRVYPEGKIGIVCEETDDRGVLTVQMPQNRKKRVLYKRLRLIASADQMYPPDYDFSIVFDTVENRKAAHTMSRKFDADAVVVISEGKADAEKK